MNGINGINGGAPGPDTVTTNPWSQSDHDPPGAEADQGILDDLNRWLAEEAADSSE